MSCFAYRKIKVQIPGGKSLYTTGSFRLTIRSFSFHQAVNSIGVNYLQALIKRCKFVI